MDPNSVTVGWALLAGLASFLSPCVLALVPAYIGYLGGRSVAGAGQSAHNRWVTFTHGLAFVVGFSAVFVGLGAAASAIGGFLYDIRPWITRIGGVIVIVFGLQTMGLINVPFLNYEVRPQFRPNRSLGYLSSALMGVFFSAGWTPCVGPVLSAVFFLAYDSAQVGWGVVLLSAYSAGLAIPFLLAALGIGQVAHLMRRHAKAIRVISWVTGAMLVVLGVLLLTDKLGLLARFGPSIDFGL